MRKERKTHRSIENTDPKMRSLSHAIDVAYWCFSTLSWIRISSSNAPPAPKSVKYSTVWSLSWLMTSSCESLDPSARTMGREKKESCQMEA